MKSSTLPSCVGRFRSFHAFSRRLARACVIAATPLIALPAAAETYIVLFEQYSVPGTTLRAVSSAGGTVVANYAPIGVAVARSDNPGFAAALRGTKGVRDVAATRGVGVVPEDPAALESANAAPSAPLDPPTPSAGSDPLSGLQWDMDQISAPAARAINGGSRSIVVGAIHTGIDFTHPDLAPNVDFANSVSCVSGAPDTSPSAWLDDNGLGTFMAGIIAAARNGIGIVGVAPNVRIAGIKAGNTNGFFYPEAVVCALMWSATHNIQVIYNGYFVDPWLYNCRNDPTQRAIWEAVRRAAAYAMQKGSVLVAAAGSFSDDLAHRTQDVSSPDDTSPVFRSITNACAMLPLEIPGVIGVTANGNLELKAFYSSYGLGRIEVTAPGGDSRLQLTTSAPNGRVLSTWPAALANTCLRKVLDVTGAVYCYQQGSSVAAAHAAGVAALIASTGVASPAAVAARLVNTADPLPCPDDLSIYEPFPSLSNGAPQQCVGGIGYNNFNGRGQINALTAVSP